MVLVFYTLHEGDFGGTNDNRIRGYTEILKNKKIVLDFEVKMQQALPRHLLGRIMGALALTKFGFYPLSVALGGILVAHYGPVFVFLLNGTLLLIPCIFGLFQHELREL